MADSGPMLGHVSLEVIPRSDGRDLIESQSIYLRESGGLPHRARTRTVVRENNEGQALFIESTSTMGRFRTRTRARISGERVEVERETPSGQTRETIILPDNVRFDDGDGLVQNWTPEALTRLEFLNFDSDTMAVERIVIEA